MCLLKVYVDNGKSGRKLVAEGIALVAKENGRIKLKNLELKEISLDNAEIVSIDTLNSVLLLKRRRAQT
ncbi:MAG: CooT family nickel-binding protein [Candidatus Bathyarchaeia archaeon]